ncbi:MAG: hypothetical protein GX927_08680 [Lentisphaerae bacterium]|nr:hypothetical protein [Lentisphaerota bacterium]
MNLKKIFAGALVFVMCCGGYALRAEEAAAALEDKLLPLVTMEQAFAKALQRRALLARLIEQETAKLKESSGEEATKISQGLVQARKAFSELTTYMDVIFGLGGTRAYEYDSVKSTIYLRVGTITEVFARAIQARDNYAKRIVELKDIIEKEEDETRKATLQKEHDTLVQRWALVVNALYSIYQVHPKRNYQFNPSNLTLYLKTNDEELQKLQAEIEKNKKQAEEAQAAEK